MLQMGRKMLTPKLRRERRAKKQHRGIAAIKSISRGSICSVKSSNRVCIACAFFGAAQFCHSLI